MPIFSLKCFRTDTEAMAAQLEEVSQAVAPGAHAVLLLDQAGWHVSPKLKVPANITLLPLPAALSGVEPGRERLAVHARQLAVEPGLRLLRADHRSLL